MAAPGAGSVWKRTAVPGRWPEHAWERCTGWIRRLSTVSPPRCRGREPPLSFLSRSPTAAPGHDRPVWVRSLRSAEAGGAESFRKRHGKCWVAAAEGRRILGHRAPLGGKLKGCMRLKGSSGRLLPLRSKELLLKAHVQAIHEGFQLEAGLLVSQGVESLGQLLHHGRL